MTLEDLIGWLSGHPGPLLGVFLALPLVAGLAVLLRGRPAGGATTGNYLYSLLVYAACIPGMFSVVLTVYALFFRNANLLGVNVLVYFLPILSMGATLLVVRRGVRSFDEVPGFGRLSGLMLMLGASLAAAFALHRLHFGIFFLAPLAQFITIALVVFALLRLGVHRLAGGGDRRSLRDVIREPGERDPR